MGVFSRRVNKDDLRPEQKWDFISLNDFKSTSCLTPFAYAYLWISLVISTAVYGVDTFTAVNLLAFNRWSGEIQPIIPLNVSKWIFSGCIIASWINIGFEHLRAWRVMRRGAVAESYLDNLAVRLESIKMGQTGRGWRRFLVFAELTKSKKGTEYVALFTYFAFQSWIRVVFCQGPRQVINALTLYSVFHAKLDPTESNDVGDALLTFFKKVGILAEQEHQQAVILSGMIFTLVIWIFSALSLILAILFYLLFLWHYIPNHDGGLTGYCERKINERLTKIVSAKVNKAIEEEERKRTKAEQRAVKKGEKVSGRQATIPALFDSKEDDKLPDMPVLNRADTMATLPQYTSRPGTPSSNLPQTASFELEKLDQKRPLPGRSVTGSSYASNAPLMGNAGDMGRLPDLPPLDTDMPFPAPQRTNTGGSQGSQWQRGPPQGPPQGPPRMPSAMGDRGFTASPLSYADGRNTPGFPGPQRQNTMDSFGRPIPRSHTPMGPGPAPSIGRRTPFDPAMQNPQNRMMSPASEYGSEYGRQTPFNPALQNQGRPSPAPGSEFGGPRPPFNFYNDQGRSSPAPGSEFGGPRPPFNYNQQGRSSPAPGPDFNRRTPFDPALQNNGRSSPAPSNMGQRYGQNTPSPPSTNPAGYKPFNPNSINPTLASPVEQEEQHQHGFNFGTGTSSPPRVRNLTEPIPRAATTGPEQMRSYGNRNEDYGDEEMGSISPPRRAATEVGEFNPDQRTNQNQTHQRHGSESGSGSGSAPWGGYR
ncbi:putative pheromone-regulated membrane protein [Botrytis fragariae]|uniref:Putative pheromone-regulated membrane protein n=1 Tax=Botrytis fragariae TaxID=1964551 RepID=A0A8H6AQ57_9HELO|nr:putative pheromone-regulated membrane protein [Botrytis fragariae]KAF5871557.1 putative pheromone-regulated membrane protein [Botrytis fragariae]